MLKEKLIELIKTTKIFYWYRKNFYETNIKSYNKTPLEKNQFNEYLRKLIDSDKPIMISRLGSNELNVLQSNYKKIKYSDKLKYVMKNNAGFFPADEKGLDEFAKVYFHAIKYIDVLGIWFNPFEDIVCNEFCPNAEITILQNLEPYFADNPWSYALKNRKVLVIHPFAKSIEKQYHKREKLFNNQEVLPDFKLITYQAVQSIGGSTEYESWFEALDKMKKDIEEFDFDIAIIGAGAYGLPLAAYIKSIGKKAIHLGGSTQMLFGVYGRRWELNPDFKDMINEFWVTPEKSETPKNASNVENACYW